MVTAINITLAERDLSQANRRLIRRISTASVRPIPLVSLHTVYHISCAFHNDFMNSSGWNAYYPSFISLHRTL